MSIELTPYNPKWPELYSQKETEIKQVLGNNLVQIHHVGSTAVLGLVSKNKLDIALQVRDGMAAIKNLEQISYKHSGEWNIPFRYGHTYRPNDENDIKVNMHMFDFAHPAIEYQLLFRDHLRSCKEDRELYAKLKQELVLDENAHKKDSPNLYNYSILS